MYKKNNVHGKIKKKRKISVSWKNENLFLCKIVGYKDMKSLVPKRSK